MNVAVAVAVAVVGSVCCAFSSGGEMTIKVGECHCLADHF